MGEYYNGHSIKQLSSSGLSLKSLEKKEEPTAKSSSVDNEANFEENLYNETDIVALWEKYSEMMEEKGRFNSACKDFSPWSKNSR